MGLIGFCNADWVGEKDDSFKSTTGFAFLLNGTAICWLGPEMWLGPQPKLSVRPWRPSLLRRYGFASCWPRSNRWATPSAFTASQRSQSAIAVYDKLRPYLTVRSTSTSCITLWLTMRSPYPTSPLLRWWLICSQALPLCQVLMVTMRTSLACVLSDVSRDSNPCLGDPSCNLLLPSLCNVSSPVGVLKWEAAWEAVWECCKPIEHLSTFACSSSATTT
eukprot:356039-Chlamydomonas_euryale.AAC.2